LAFLLYPSSEERSRLVFLPVPWRSSLVFLGVRLSVRGDGRVL